MSFFKLSPNEVDRLLQEEKRKLKIERLKQVREQAKAQSVKLRQSVEGEKKRLEQIVQNKLKSQWQAEHSKQILKAEDNLKNTLLEIGGSHRNALELNVDLLDEQKTLKDVENHCTALKREKEALALMRDEKEKQESKHMQQLLDRHSALDVEKARAAMIASLPKPAPKAEPPKELPRTKAHSRTSGTNKVIVEKENIDYNFPIRTALDEAEILEQKFESLEEKKQRVIRERRQKALMRHKEALEREHQTKEQQDIDQDLKDIRKEEIAMKKSEVDKLSKQVLMNNLNQKEKADDDELKAGQINYKNLEDTKGRSSTNGDATSELCYTSSLPLDDASSLDDIVSELVSPTTADEEASRPTKLCDTGSHDSNSRWPDEVQQPLCQMGFHLDEQARKRLIELVKRQKSAAKQRQEVTPVELKDAALQTSLDASSGASTKKHEAVQVLMEELEDGIDAGSEDWNVSNSFIPSFHSIEAPSFDSVLPVENVDHQEHDIDEIRKRKHELINELKAIDQEMSKMLESNADDNPPMAEKTGRNNAMAKDQSEKHHKEIHHSPDIIVPSIHHSLNESFPSSNSSTQYLHLPMHRNTIGNSSNSKAENVMDLYDSETSQITIGCAASPIKEAANQLQTDQSPCSSTKTNYHNIPILRRKRSGNSLSESSLRSSSCELPSISNKSSTSLKSLSPQKGTIKPSKHMIVGGGDANPVLQNPLGSTGVKMGLKSSIENSVASSDLPNLLEYLNPNSSLTSLGNGSVDSPTSERASIISLELHDQEGDSERLPSNQGSSSALNTIVSKFIHFYSPKSTDPRERGCLTSDPSDHFNSSRSSEHNFAWLEFFNPLHAMNSAIDINSERASFISVELLNPETESTSLSSEQESPSGNIKPWKTLKTFHSEDSSTINGNISSNDLKEITKFNNLDDPNNTADIDASEDFNKYQILSYQPTRNWLKILEPYRESSEPTAKILQGRNNNKNDIIQDDYISCSSASQFQGFGILDEPDLTLTSANSTMSLPCDSLQNSGMMSSSLHSFERHEIKFYQQSMDQSIEHPSVGLQISIPQSIDDAALQIPQVLAFERVEPQTSRQKNLMYPRKWEIENNLKGALDSWKRSRATTSQKHASPNNSKNDINK